MRKSRKSIVIAGTVTGVLVGGAAFAYWSSTGTGTGSGSTTAGDSNLTYSQAALADMYPGKAAQPLKVTVTNKADNNARVAGVTAYVTTNKAGCDGTDIQINGSNSSEATPVALTWTAIDLAKDASSTNGADTIGFLNKNADQDACKGAAITVHYASN